MDVDIVSAKISMKTNFTQTIPLISSVEAKIKQNSVLENNIIRFTFRILFSRIYNINKYFAQAASDFLASEVFCEYNARIFWPFILFKFTATWGLQVAEITPTNCLLRDQAFANLGV